MTNLISIYLNILHIIKVVLIGLLKIEKYLIKIERKNL